MSSDHYEKSRKRGEYIQARERHLSALKGLPRLAQVALVARVCQRELRHTKHMGLFHALSDLAGGNHGSRLEPHLSLFRKYVEELEERGREPHDDYEAMWRAVGLRGVLTCVDAVPLLLSPSTERRAAGCDQVVKGVKGVAEQGGGGPNSSTIINEHFWGIFPYLRDLDLLIALAESEQWSDDTAVDMDVLGAPFSVAEYDLKAWEAYVLRDNEPTKGNEIVVEIDVPDGTSDEEVIRTVREFAELADGLHRVYGGRGLEVRTVECFVGMSVATGGAR